MAIEIFLSLLRIVPLLLSNRVTAAGNPPRVLFFPSSSHTITTRQTGLTFDWGEEFHPDYYPAMLEWIGTGSVGVAGTRLSRTEGASEPRNFVRGAMFGEASLARGAIIQLVLFLVLPIALVFSGVHTAWKVQSTGRSPLRLADLAVSIGGLLIDAGFVVFLTQSVFVQGLEVMESYAIPAWQKWLPIAGSFVALGAALTVILRFRQRMFIGSVPAILLLIWCLNWQMVGPPL